MRSEEARIGQKVIVTTDHRKPELRGMIGFITGRYGSDDYLALDVHLECGYTELFWHHQLEEAGEQFQNAAVEG